MHPDDPGVQSVMRCLMCGKDTGISERIGDILFYEDMICRSCRAGFHPYGKAGRFSGVRTEILYVYEDMMRSALIQFKECGDEALKDVFLYRERTRLRLKYHGYTLLLMPSGKTKTERRGFSHLREMFSSLCLPMEEPFAQTAEMDQKGKNRRERERMAANIILKKDAVLPEKILLADDVITTGSTLRGALRLLDDKKHTIRILAVSGTKSLP